MMIVKACHHQIANPEPIAGAFYVALMAATLILALISFIIRRPFPKMALIGYVTTAASFAMMWPIILPPITG